MRNALINNPGKARYFVLEPKATKVTEITSPLGEEWHCLKIVVTPTHQVRLSLYRSKHSLIERMITPYEQGLYIWDTLDKLLKKAGGWSTSELPYQIRSALFGLRGRNEEYYFWKPKASKEDWALPQFTPVTKWRNFACDGTYDDNYTENYIGNAETHFRLDIVIPKPWHKGIKRSMLLWTPGSKTPRRYNISSAETRKDLNEKLKKSGFNIEIPWYFDNNLSDWSCAFSRLWLK